MTIQPTTPASTWAIPDRVRRALRTTVLDLRATLEENFGRQLTALGIRTGGIGDLPAARGLTLEEEAARRRAYETASAVIRREVEGGATHAEALDGYIREAAYTFLNRVVGLRCIEERGLLLVGGQRETAIRTDPARGASSLYWRVRNEKGAGASPREVWRETLHRAHTAVSEQIGLLFDPKAEHAALLPLPPALQQVMTALNSAEIPTETWAVDEALGWVYQYYNQQEKQEVYARLGKGKKLERPEEIAAATCLYTERYMVDYLLQNTLGALWVEMHPDSRLPATWPYYVRPPEGNQRLTRPPRRVRDLTLIDPACGSGHFLVRAFDLLAAMYEEEGLEASAEVPRLILERNLHGLDIDGRAVQIAALALYLKASSYAGQPVKPRRLNLVAADVLLPGDTPPDRYLARFQGDKELEALVTGIWQGLKNAREFGSLLHPERTVDAVVKRRRDREQGSFFERGDGDWQRWKDDLLAGLREEFEQQAQTEDLGQKLFGQEAARGVSLVEVLGHRYDIVVANPPYQGSGGFNVRLKQLVEREYKEGKRDLYAAFILRCRDFCKNSGVIGMATQQSWLFQSTYTALRRNLIEQTRINTLVHLGPRAFEEISGEVVRSTLFTLGAITPDSGHRFVSFRLVGPKTPTEKSLLLRDVIYRRAHGQSSEGVGFASLQLNLLLLDGVPVSYWLGDHFFELLTNGLCVRDIGDVRPGICTGDDNRYLRCYWEVDSHSARWSAFAKGGGYARWQGLDWLVIDWEGGSDKFTLLPGGRVRSIPWQGREGLTYSLIAGGSLGVRYMASGTVFGHKGPGLFGRRVNSFALAAYLNSHFSTYLARAFSPSLAFELGTILRLPWVKDDRRLISKLTRITNHCNLAKTCLLQSDPTLRDFLSLEPERERNNSLISSMSNQIDSDDINSANLLVSETQAEQIIWQEMGLRNEDQDAIVSETGRPSGFFPLIDAYSSPVPSLGAGTVIERLDAHPSSALSPFELTKLKNRLKNFYHAGPGAKVQDDLLDSSYSGDDSEDEGNATAGAYIPVPSETFLEELSQKLQVHPISVYWLLKELREQDGLVCPPELKRHLEDYISVSILRLLGYRWPGQGTYEREHGPILDPAMVDEDGIIPLVACVDQPTAYQRVHARLVRDFGEAGAEQSEREFRQYVGRDLESWLRRDFFRRHIQQFKQRPIAWHLVSPERTFEAFVLYHKLSRATLQKLRAQYAGGLVARLQTEQERVRQRNDTAPVSRLQLQIEDVEEFRKRLEAIERGDDLQYRIRCRWKGETTTGRPGPYAPDIDDGVKVNIRPFQEAGLLAVREVIKKW